MGSTKNDLYRAVEQVRDALNLDLDFPLDLIRICKENKHINIVTETLKTKGLCLIAFLGDTEDMIILNNRRNDAEQNFDCAHELMHISLHRNYSRSFHCYDKVQDGQNRFIEWAANEGAAQLLLPMDKLLPLIKESYSGFYCKENIARFKEELSDIFFVSPTVVMFRLESLKYEIEQYIKGVEMENIEILSERQQKLKKIKVKSLNNRQKDLEFEPAYVAEQNNINYMAQQIEEQLDSLNPYEHD